MQYNHVLDFFRFLKFISNISSPVFLVLNRKRAEDTRRGPVQVVWEVPSLFHTNLSHERGLLLSIISMNFSSLTQEAYFKRLKSTTRTI